MGILRNIERSDQWSAGQTRRPHWTLSNELAAGDLAWVVEEVQPGTDPQRYFTNMPAAPGWVHGYSVGVWVRMGAGVFVIRELSSCFQHGRLEMC